MMRSYWSKVGPSSSLTGVLIRNGGRERKRERQKEDGYVKVIEAEIGVI